MTFAESDALEPQLAWRMAALAFVMQTITVGCIFGPFGVLLTAVEARTGASRALTSLALPLVSMSAALTSPVAGFLASRISLRLLLAIGTIFGIAGYLLLSASGSIVAFLIAYGLLIGPCMCLTSSVLPSVLVSRWFEKNRGRALGLIHIPVMTVILPVPTTYLLRSAGLPIVYATLAALMFCALFACLFVIDRPPDALTSGAGAGESAPKEWTMGRIAMQPWFWGMVVAVAAPITGGVTLSVHAVAMVRQWGIGDAPAAGLLSMSALAGMAGAPIFGWVADKLGGRLALAMICLDSAVLWAVLLAHPPYLVLAPTIALLGLHVTGVVPVFTLAASRRFGPAYLGEALGLAILIALMLPLATAPLTAALYLRSGSYGPVIVAHVALLLVGALGALLVRTTGDTARGRAGLAVQP